jgi:hypothetical protein
MAPIQPRHDDIIIRRRLGEHASTNTTGFKSGPPQRLTTSDLFLVVYEVGFAGARNQHYLQLWHPAA